MIYSLWGVGGDGGGARATMREGGMGTRLGYDITTGAGSHQPLLLRHTRFLCPRPMGSIASIGLIQDLSSTVWIVFLKFYSFTFFIEKYPFSTWENVTGGPRGNWIGTLSGEGKEDLDTAVVNSSQA